MGPIIDEHHQTYVTDSAASPKRGEGEGNLDRSLVHGVAWSASARAGSQAVTWVVTLVVARILTPSDYGIVSASVIYLGLVGMLTEFGLSTAIVAQRDLDQNAIAQLGGLAVILGLAAWVITVLVAPLIANLVGVSEVRQVLPVMGFATALSALNALPFALLQKSLRFARLSSLEVFKTFVAAISLFAFAVAGWGFWSLVLNEVVAVFVLSIALYLSTRYRLAFPRISHIRTSLALSGRVMASRFAYYTYSNADVAIVSRVLGKTVLGDYAMAWNLTNLPSQKIAGTIMSVTTGIFASVQHNSSELRRYFIRLAEGLAIVLWPATIGMALVAPEMVAVLLGEKWKGAIPIIQALAVATAIRGIAPICSQVLLARMRANIEMRYNLLSAVALPIGFIVGSRYGAVGVALAWSILSPPIIFFQFWVTCREIELPLKELAAVLLRPAAAVVFMGATLVASRILLRQHDVRPMIQLMAMVAVGVLSYGSIVAAVMRQRVFAIIRVIKTR